MKIEIRTTCKICKIKITENRFRTYCSKKCRNKRDATKWNKYRADWQRKVRDEKAKIFSPNKIQCLSYILVNKVIWNSNLI